MVWVSRADGVDNRAPKQSAGSEIPAAVEKIRGQFHQVTGCVEVRQRIQTDGSLGLRGFHLCNEPLDTGQEDGIFVGFPVGEFKRGFTMMLERFRYTEGCDELGYRQLGRCVVTDPIKNYSVSEPILGFRGQAVQPPDEITGVRYRLAGPLVPLGRVGDGPERGLISQARAFLDAAGSDVGRRGVKCFHGGRHSYCSASVVMSWTTSRLGRCRIAGFSPVPSGATCKPKVPNVPFRSTQLPSGPNMT